MEATSRGPPRVKNKAAAPIQISAEQLLREAVDRQEPASSGGPTTRFADLEELHEFQGRKRKDFEDYVQRNRVNVNNWLRYAAWELEQKEFRRARSVFERALDVDATNVVVWLRYAEAEMRNRNINHARNIFDRAVTILPRVDKLWYKYVYMEEMLGNVPGTRQVFDRWMSWEPDESAWHAYIKLERRYGETSRARALFERFTIVHPEPRHWLKWARFEEDSGSAERVRAVFGLAIETLGDEFLDESIFLAYARYEAREKELDRARAIYRYALDRLPRASARALHAAYTTFEKQFGDKAGLEHVVLAKRRVQYEDQVRANPLNYDAWFDYIRLEESSASAAADEVSSATALARTRELYERAIAHLPPSDEKRHWRRYIYLWLFYAAWEEGLGMTEEGTGTGADHVARARAIWQQALRVIPHAKFTFAKVWLGAARFEIRQEDASAARKLLGRAVGMCPKASLFRAYIALEVKMFEFGRCRRLYEKWISWDAGDSGAWIAYATLEAALDDAVRARACFELAVAQEDLDMPELVWKKYIEFEDGEGELERARALYERLLQKTSHVKVWISFAQFEINAEEEAEIESHLQDGQGEGPASVQRARMVFQKALDAHPVPAGGPLLPAGEDVAAEARITLLHALRAFEAEHGTDKLRQAVEDLMPRRIKKRRRLDEGAFEEIFVWDFPEADGGLARRKLASLLSMAREWKEGLAAATGTDTAKGTGTGTGMEAAPENQIALDQAGPEIL